MPPDPWKQVAQCSQSPLGLARTPGLLQPCSPGKTVGMWLSAAETQSPKETRRGWLTHGFWSVSLIFIYSLVIDLVFLYLI